MVIAIDGPAGAGKSTVARALAARLRFTYLDSGAMYRCVALAAQQQEIDPDDPAALGRLAADLDLRMSRDRVELAGRDVTEAIRAPEVSAIASRVSVHPAVRESMVERQRSLVADGRWVAEGRDIGTVVCPDAPLKIYLTASEHERARRRAVESDRAAIDVLAEQRARDARDSEREHGALEVAPDAVELDTTGLALDEVVAKIAGIATDRGLS